VVLKLCETAAREIIFYRTWARYNWCQGPAVEKHCSRHRTSFHMTRHLKYSAIVSIFRPLWNIFLAVIHGIFNKFFGQLFWKPSRLFIYLRPTITYGLTDSSLEEGPALRTWATAGPFISVFSLMNSKTFHLIFPWRSIAKMFWYGRRLVISSTFVVHDVLAFREHLFWFVITVSEYEILHRFL
jgi:hypothetical protein